MIGNLISQDKRTKFGFAKIKGEEDTYFVHSSEFKDKEVLENLRVGSVLDFDYKATPKGLRAIKVTFVKNPEKKAQKRNNRKNNSLKKAVMIDNFIVRREGTPRGKMEYECKLELDDTVYSFSEAKGLIVDLAKKLGFNCIFNINKEFYPKSPRGMDGAVYNTFSTNATVGIITTNVNAKNKEEVEQAKKHIESMIKKAKKNIKKYDNPPKAVEEKKEEPKKSSGAADLVNTLLWMITD